MDRPAKKKRISKKPYIFFAFVLILVFISYWVFANTGKRVSKSDMEIKMVQQGPFKVYAIGNGTVVPKNVDYIMPKINGELSVVNVRSGDSVVKDQILFVIENEELMTDYGNHEIALAEAKAALGAKTFDLETVKLELERTTLEAETAYEVQNAEYQAYKSLQARSSLPVARLIFEQSEIKVIQQEKIYKLELTRLKNFKASMNTQINQYESRVRSAENILSRTTSRVDSLRLKAKMNGVIQDVDLKQGQHVDVGTVIGIVSNLDQIYIRLSVSAVQANRIKLGQSAIITIRKEDKVGKVVRIDPNVKGTTIDVDVELDEDITLPSNMYVSGKIIIEELSDALFVDAPSGIVEDGVSYIYRLDENGQNIQLTKVETGLLSAGKVLIRGGLSSGDKIVISSTSHLNGVSQISLH